MKHYAFTIVLLVCGLPVTFISGSEASLKETAINLGQALSPSQAPKLTNQEMISMAVVTLASAKIGYDIIDSSYMIGKTVSIVVPAVIAFISTGASTELGRFMTAQQALDPGILNTLGDSVQPLPSYLQDRLRTAQTALRPTHHTSVNHITPLLIS